MRKTTEKDLHNLMTLWNRGDVMNFVGFPNGLSATMDSMTLWLEKINQDSSAKHWCLYARDLFLGEAYYRYELEGPSIIDIKLLPEYRGKNIAYRAVCTVLDMLFRDTPAKVAQVDPHKENGKSIALYERLGFERKEVFLYEGEAHVLMLLEKSMWRAKRLDSVHLDEITFENYIEAAFLSVHPEQEEFIATNSFSMAQAHYQPTCHPLCITADQNMVGFLMYNTEDIDDHLVWIYRLMIDQKYQSLGYGKRAMEQLIPRLKRISKTPCLRISFEPTNDRAKVTYESLGFRTTGWIEGGEVIYELTW